LTLPKPLIVVIIVVLVIALVSCGATLLRRDESGGDSLGNRAELDGGGFARLFKAFKPGSDPVRLPPATSNPNGCFSSFASCVITIPPSEDLRRELRLAHASGIMSVRVVGQVNGAAVDNSVNMPNDTDEVSVVVTRNDSATVVLSCLIASCAVNLNP
jgi:hypothetical protein